MSKNTRDRIVEAAITLLAKDPRASLDDIADAAEVGRATVYRLFKNKSLLLKELMLQANTEAQTVLGPINRKECPLDEILFELVEGMIPIASRFRFLSFEPFAHEPACMEVQEYWHALWQNFAKRLKQDGLVAADMPTAWSSACFNALIYAAWSCVEEGDIAVKDAPRLVVRSFLNGLSDKEYDKEHLETLGRALK